MELHKAIKEIVTSKGADMITNGQIINYLLDYQAFREIPASKPILRDIINAGYANKILSINANSNESILKLNHYQHDFVCNYGYQEDLVTLVFEAIVYGLGWNLSKIKKGESQVKTTPSGPSMDSQRKARNITKMDNTEIQNKLDAEGRMNAWLKDREERKDEIEARRKQLYNHYYGDRVRSNGNASSYKNKVSREFAKKAIKALFNDKGNIRFAFNEADLMLDQGEIKFLQDLGIVDKNRFGLPVCVLVFDINEINRRVEDYYNS